MRTTIEIKPEHRSALIALAAQRGEKGFSAVIGEAIEEYINGKKEREERRKTLLSLAGSLSQDDAESLRKVTESTRASWR